MMNGLSNGRSGGVVPDQRSMFADFSQIDTLTSHPENEVEFSKGKTTGFAYSVCICLAGGEGGGAGLKGGGILCLC